MTDAKAAKAAAKRDSSSSSLWKWGAGAAAAGAVLGGTALLNRSRAKQAERDNPPIGRFIEVDGVRLHYLERGEGRPLVLLHGNGTMIEDWIVSGLFDELAKSYRVIAFDRPGFGHSERPRTRVWTPTAQAALLTQAFKELALERPLVVGHSFGALVTAALAINHPGTLSGIVLLGGYYYPTLRADVPFIAPAATPVVGDVMRHTVSPLLGAALMPRINAKIFEPAPIPERWLQEFPIAMTLRPSQIQAEAAEAGLMVPAAAAIAGRFGEIHMPVTIVAGEGDAIVDTSSQARPLHKAIPQSRLTVVEGAGHMVHHTAPDEVIAAVRAM